MSKNSKFKQNKVNELLNIYIYIYRVYNIAEDKICIFLY